jgi:UDP-glucose 4-epimerase
LDKVLVTGASGFIGGYVIEELLRRGRNVLAFDRRRISLSYVADIETIFGDIRDSTSVTEAMAHADSWIHLAGVLGTQETVRNPRPAVETNLLGGLNVLEAAAQYATPGVNIAVGNWFEDNPYSLTKYSIERFCSMYRRFRDVSVTVVRAYNAYGPRQSVAAPYGPSKVRKMIPSFIMRALTGDPIQVYGDGLQIMDMIYVRDVADMLVRALERTERLGRDQSNIVFEAGSGNETTVVDIAKEVIGIVGRGTVEHLPPRVGETPGVVVLANTSGLSALGVDPTMLTPLDVGLRDTVEYYREYAKRR